MSLRYFGRNIRTFTAFSNGSFGREIITTAQDFITSDNIVAELQKALPIHEQNAIEIEYLDRYYRGDQPILYRHKKNRPEVNNKIVINIAQYIVDVKASEIAGEPIQYVLRGKDEEKTVEINKLNTLMDGEDKSYFDIELCRWRSICGTAYRYIGAPDKRARVLDESIFSLKVEDPRNTFVVYYDDDTPAFSCQIRKDAEGNKVFWVYTPALWFKIIGDEIVDEGINGNGAIPVIEYPNNARRLSDIEITLTITDEINRMASDRANAVEQFVSAFVKFVNCDIDIEKFRELRAEGFFSVTTNEGASNAADVDIMTSELNQSETQVAVDDLFEKLLVIHGIANRQSNSGGDTAGAVSLRNGHYDQEKRAELGEPIFKRSERQALRLVLKRLKIEEHFKLMPSDVEIKISRSKLDNMLTKAEVLKLLLDCGIDYQRAIKTVGLFSDPEQVSQESKARMELLYPTEITEATDANESGRTEQPEKLLSGNEPAAE